MLTRSTPTLVRLAAYGICDALTIARAVVSAPAAPSSWGRLLNLPRFGVVEPARIYRSGEPRNAAHRRHARRLGIRTLFCVRGGGPSPAGHACAEKLGIEPIVFDLGPDFRYDIGALDALVDAALDPALQPALIYCDGGRHRAGMACALIRLRRGWCLRRTIAEYEHFAEPTPYADNVKLIASMTGA